MYVKLSWRPEVDENWAIMVVQLAILTVSQKNAKNQYAVLPGISVRVLASHFRSVIGNFRSSGWLDLHVWYLNTFVTCTNILRYNTCMSSYPGDRKWTKRAIIVVQPAMLTYPTMVFYFWRRGLCFIYISSFYFWSPPLPRKMRKTNVLYYPEYPPVSWHSILAP
jgi:hypothetical protein